MEQQFLDFISKIGVMKPASVDEEDEVKYARLKGLLLSNEYDAENKIDGCHYMIFGFRFFSTEGCEKTNNYPHLKEYFTHLQMPNLILDGEINYPDKTSQFCTRVTGAEANNAISFQNLNGYIHYTMWDILRTPKGTWLLNKTYRERRTILETFYNSFIKGTSLEQYIHLTDRVTGMQKKAFYDDLIASGKEGVVLKKIDSFYIMGKKPMWQWMKIKQKDEADFWISGFEPPTVLYTGKNIIDWPYWQHINNVYSPVTKNYYFDWIGAIELSAFVDGIPTKICTCSGITEELRNTMSKNKEVFLNRVAKISFMEKTEAGYPRHPRFQSLHESKTPQECIWELYL